MKTLPDKLVAEAFALSNARGAELLARLGEFDVWRGDLASMRGDEPRQPEADEQQDSPPTLRIFLDTLVLARAIELLQPVCRAALAATYAETKDPASLAAELDTSTEYAQRMVATCERRLLEIYDALTTSEQDQTRMPEWVSEREHAAAGGSRRR